MKILSVCDSPSWDIVSYQAAHMSARLQKHGHEAEVMCPSGSPVAAECAKLKVRTLPVPLKARLGFFDAAGRDIVHFYNPSVLPPAVFRRARASARVLVSQYRLGSDRAFSRLADISGSVDLFLGGCNSVQEDFISAGIRPDRMFMLPPAINIARWESAMLIKKTMPPRPPFKVGTVTMDPTFREQELFLMMAKEVLHMLPETHFMLVGLRSEVIRKLARGLDISHRVDILSDRNDMPEVMAMMNIYAKTSLCAGLSMSVIEAQASGVPCVIPRLRGLSDFTVNERNGLIVKPGDVLDCARAVIRLINDQQAARGIADTAYQYVNNNMSAPVSANILARLYEDILSK